MACGVSALEKGSWRVAGYARLSRDDGAIGESDSIVGQRAIIDEWVASRGDVVKVAQYVDDGYSGATFDRPGFRQMIADARAGLFDTIVVKDLSRFGRSYLDCGAWIERRLPEIGVRLYSIADEFDSLRAWDYNTALLFPMKNLVNEMQVISTSHKVRASLAAKRQRGECVANFAPYGYVKDAHDRHKLAIDDEAACVVRRIFVEFLAGLSAAAIARNLNAEGVPSPMRRKAELGLGYRTGFASGPQPKWHAMAVLRIVRDETYTGTLVQGKSARPNFRAQGGVALPREQWCRVGDAHERIVCDETYAEAQLALGAKRRRHEPETVGACREDGTAGMKEARPKCLATCPESPGEGVGNGLSVPLLGHIICDGCGARMRRISVSSKGRRYSYYVCSTHRKNASLCRTHSVREEALVSQLRRLHAREAVDPAGGDTEASSTAHRVIRVDANGIATLVS